MPLNLESLFPDADYRFHLGLRKGEPAPFYAHSPSSQTILQQRSSWIEAAPEEYLACEAEGAELLDEFATLFGIKMGGDGAKPSHLERCVALARQLEPDFLLLRADGAGAFRLVAGAVCFPSGWALREKIGRSVAEVHGIVPGLNAALERQINSFLGRLGSGVSWERENWGLSRTPELNLHPVRQMPRLVPPFGLGEVWVRVEHQSFIGLPRTHGIAFGIRLKIESLDAVVAEADARRRVARALRTMPEEVASYKGLAEARPLLVALLEKGN